MNTYEKIKMLCEKDGFSISSIPQKIPGISISKASITGWKNGSVPRPDKIKALADYFGVTTEYLINDNEDTTVTMHAPESEKRFTEQERALLKLFKKMDVVKQAQLLAYAADLVKNSAT